MNIFCAKRALLTGPLVFYLFCATFLYGQSRSSALDMAKSYEDDGLYEKAVPIYEDLYKKDPSNIVILDKLKNGYRALGRYESLIQVLSETLKTDSLNAVLLSELADAHFRARRIPEAQGIVTKIVRLDPFSETTYRLTASVLKIGRAHV